MRYSGDVYRPPSEANSLIVQVTYGCSHNKCAFCNMYKAKRFTIRPIEEVFEDLAWARAHYRYIQRVFLADGDALILPMEHLRRILEFIRVHIPECERVAVYGSPRSIQLKTPAQLAQLKEEGLGIVYMGLESGNDALLKKYNKGETAAEIVEGGLKVRDAGLALSVTAINGMGGVEMWQPHAIDTAKALSAMKPEYIGLLTLRVYHGTPLAKWVQEGSITQLDPLQLAAETRLLLEHIDSEGSIFRSNHASNYLVLRGTLNKDKPALLRQIDAALAGKQPFRKYVELGF